MIIVTQGTEEMFRTREIMTSTATLISTKSIEIGKSVTPEEDKYFE